ncbi:hypothetical protein Acr_05g0012020 [Actinidia rufa]|uniref:Uncharacterized protein n=1 Tax=Actinidia rufa TaxID=165716 RepID=A0A7J0EM67_9ERIC|nr:hypothetical protein Acr_05g0012020 [Actinidia rufa]
MDFLARIWAEHRVHVVQASLCPVSLSGFPLISVCQPSFGVTVGAAVENNQELFPSSGRPPRTLELGRGLPRLRELDAHASYTQLSTLLPCWAFPTYGEQLGFLRPRFVPLGPSDHLPHFQDMALNRAQMLVRDSEALAQFRVDHRIPDDVVIERPGPNDDADWVEGEGNRVPIRTCLCDFVRTVLAVETLMRREGLEFTVEDLFHVYCVVKPRKNPETQMLEGNHYLRLRKPNQPQTRLVTDSPDKDQHLNDFIWVSGQWEFLVNEPDPFSVPRHRGYVPIGYVPYTGIYHSSSSRSSGAPCSFASLDLRTRFKAKELRRLLEEAEGESCGSNELSSSSWDINLGNESLNKEAEVEDGKEVDQIPTAAPLVPAPLVLGPEPINLPSYDFDVAIVELREIVEHSYSHIGNSSFGSQLNAEIMAPKAPVSSTPAPAKDQSIAPSLMGGKWKGKQPTEGASRPKRGKGVGSAAGTPELWASQFAAVELGKQVTSADTSKDHETCVVLGNAVMLPQDVADHAAETRQNSGQDHYAGGPVISTGCIFLAPAKAGHGGFEEGKPEGEQPRKGAETDSVRTRGCTIGSRDRDPTAEPRPARRSDLKAVACGEVYKKLFDRASSGLGTCMKVEAHVGITETADRTELGGRGRPSYRSRGPYSARAGGLVELASRHLALTEYRSLMVVMPYLEAISISLKESVDAALLVVLNDRSGSHYHSEWKAKARLTVLL